MTKQEFLKLKTGDEILYRNTSCEWHFTAKVEEVREHNIEVTIIKERPGNKTFGNGRKYIEHYECCAKINTGPLPKETFTTKNGKEITITCLKK